jgi:hypothetical protein
MTTRPRIGVGMIGYAFMGRVHSAVWRNVAAAFEPARHPEMRAISGRDAKAATCVAAEQPSATHARVAVEI